MTWNFPINARWCNLAHITSRNCTNIAYPFKSAISSAVGKQLSCLVGLLYSIMFMSSALKMSYSVRAYLLGALAL